MQLSPLPSSKTFPPHQKEIQSPTAVTSHSSSSSPRQPLICFLSLWVGLSWTFLRDGIVRCVASSVCLLSHSSFWGSSTLQDESALHSFLWLSTVPLHGGPCVLCYPPHCVLLFVLAAACKILAPRPGTESMPPAVGAVEARVLTTGLPEKSLLVDVWMLLSNILWRLRFRRNYFCQCCVIFFLKVWPFESRASHP